MRINRRDRDINFCISLHESENPDKLKARRSSNAVFLVCALMLGSVMIIYAMAWNQNLQVERQIASTRAYIQDENNLKQYNEKLAIKAKAKKIEDYNNASARYLKQLENSARFSNKWVDFFTTEMAKTIGSESEIINYGYTGNILSLKCRTYDEKNPKLFAQHLSEMKKKDGKIMFSDVEYTGFDYQKGSFGEMTYNFDLKITLWKVESAITEEIQPEVAETLSQSEPEQ
ncbi:hypothetical protein [Robinsoniella peoriensis]|uniref:Uncharacterized protein n=1 Tax=Robinsoniella peoriensis TaxID=180332 RepID=A0A4U8Q8Y0_9FIRM|nr:hypothetical protein [Robinsoniella peoriensis]MDU7029892.1 hypothetical protein [Clostridiales bacterium]TLD01442.1 hypothetical protein DSM106044_01662 [Robinsoniella peoriensis]